MEEDILKYSPTVMFRGTPCTYEWGGLTMYKNASEIFFSVFKFSMNSVISKYLSLISSNLQPYRESKRSLTFH